MLFFADAKIQDIAVHRVGNKAQDEFYILSDDSLDLNEMDDETQAYLMRFFTDPLHKSTCVYRLSHNSGDLNLNEVYHHVNWVFKGSFTLSSIDLAKHLYEVSNHPKIKAGEFYTVKLSNVIFEGEEIEALALFKVDWKESYLDANPKDGSYQLKIVNGVGLGKVDKAAIVLNCESEHGYKVLLAENAKSFDASFWRDEFLQVKLRNDSNFQTGAAIRIFKNFVDGLDEVFEVEKMDKIDLLNKAQAYFKNNETFYQEEFEESVIGSEAAISLFRTCKTNAEELLDAKIPDDFPLSNAVIKKSKAGFKNMIKLDKNFQINVHGKRELIERGFDEEKGMNYYKVYFENES
ncbi:MULTISPECIES: nucleoid-associated protein [Sphingobacterium]|uniref:nucleoid-associated protein n=1 Tax=Sphingobacterium TaxID=28453 RepID=UPI002579EA87|nr:MULTISPECIES: nucleoid-associated protein [Sphingobacterium]